MTIGRVGKTKQGRWALFDEAGEFLFSVDGETLVKSGVRAGSVLDEAALEALRAESGERRAKDKALEYLSARDYASGELLEKLSARFDGHAAAAAVAEMTRLGLLDDARFAAHRARVLAGQNKSPREIRRHLRQKGVEGALADEAVDALALDEAAACRAVIEKSLQRRLGEGRRDLVIAALARRGFSYGAIREALESVETESAETENDG